MQITLEQLKEIAKAGYEECQPEIVSRLLDTDYELNLLNSGKLYILECECTELNIIGKNYESIIGLRYVSPIFVEVRGYYSQFNSLAAIRKMEELGLIEK
ncbi:MAG: hypothetical protein QM660_10935 [Dysgonomonas sp.]